MLGKIQEVSERFPSGHSEEKSLQAILLVLSDGPRHKLNFVKSISFVDKILRKLAHSLIFIDHSLLLSLRHQVIDEGEHFANEVKHALKIVHFIDVCLHVINLLSHLRNKCLLVSHILLDGVKEQVVSFAHVFL